ncbi:MAG: radical SAM protein [Chloroflexi bacterium]|nr:radical SAM protein [Chloroflexota bacterium]
MGTTAQLLGRVPAMMAFRSTGYPKLLPANITISLLYTCNSRCLTCNVWQKKAKNLTVDEYDRIFASLGTAPYWFTFSGGEPFLRKDIVEIVYRAYDYCRPGIINIPTNSLLSWLIPGRVEEILRRCPDTQIVLNLSLDGVGEEHDRLRGVKGNFEHFLKNYRSLRQLEYPNFTLGVHTVISRFNYQRIGEVCDLVHTLRPDSFITEMAEQRVELGTMGCDITPSAEEYAQAINVLEQKTRDYGFQRMGGVAHAFRKRYYALAKRILVEQTQVIPCYAGWASCQISPDGHVWSCCIRAESMGNLREHDYEFAKVWFSQEAEKLRTSIRNKECHCPLANASYTNLVHHIPSLIQVVSSYLPPNPVVTMPCMK